MRRLGFLSAFALIFFIYNATGFAYSDRELPQYQWLFSFVLGSVNDKDMNRWAEADASEMLLPFMVMMGIPLKPKMQT